MLIISFKIEANIAALVVQMGDQAGAVRAPLTATNIPPTPATGI